MRDGNHTVVKCGEQFKSFHQKVLRSEMRYIIHVSNIAKGRILQIIALSMLRLLSSRTEKCKKFGKLSKPCHIGIHWKAFDEHSQMSTHLLGFQSFPSFFT